MSGLHRSVLVCRGCCCGTARKHPDVDHDGQLAAWRHAAAVGGHTRVHVVGCLDACERSNVVVVRDRPGGRRRWLGDVTTPEATVALATWIASGADVADLPPTLAARAFEPNRRTEPAVRVELTAR